MNTKNRPLGAIVLVGMMAAGKTTLGSHLAQAMSRKFVDSDHVVESQQGQNIPDIFRDHGEDYFRTLEAEAIQHHIGQPVILSTGGGCITNEHVHRLLVETQDALIIWLKLSQETLFERLRYDESRPRFAGCDDSERQKRIADLCAHRDPLYKSCSDIEISTDHGDIDKAIAQIYDALQNRND